MTVSSALKGVQNTHASLANTADDDLYPYAGELLALRRACAALVEAIDSRGACLRRAHDERCENDPHYAYQYRAVTR